jgi:hypothetical protein
VAAPTIVGTGTSASAAATSVAVTAPAGVASGHHQLIFVGLHSSSETVTTPTGCTQVGSTITNSSDPTPFTLRVYHTSTVTGSITVSKSSTAAMVVGRVAYSGGGGTQATNTTASSSSSSASATITFGTATTNAADALVVTAAFESSTAGGGTPFTPGSGLTERIDTSPQVGGVYVSLNVVDIVKVAAGTQGGSVTANRSDYSISLSVVLTGAAVPTVGAGADASHPVSTAFSRTATENDNGQTITAREWKIQAGPAGVGNVLGTAAALSWTPATPGTYTLRYSATNSDGVGTDDVLVIVWPEYIRGVTTATGNGNGTDTLNVSVSKPAGVAEGDKMVMVCGNDFIAATSTDWVRLAAVGQSTFDTAFNVFEKTATASEPASYTVACGASTTAIIALVAFHQDHVTTTWDIAPALETLTSTTATTAPVAPTISPTSGEPLLLTAYVTKEASSGFSGHTPPTGMLEAADSSFTTPGRALLVTTQLLAAPGATGTRTATALGTATDYLGISMALVSVTAVAPIPNAGVDATIDQYATFSRTADDFDGGATITAREWKIVSGPNQVGAVIGTAAALSWAPTVGGSYVLRYSATNSVGTGTDDVTVTVNALNFPVTAALVLAAARTGTKRTSGAATGPVVLAATRVGAKKATGAPVAPLVLAASADGEKINAVVAPLVLAATLSNAGSSQAAFVTAALRLAGTADQRAHHTAGVTVAAPLVLTTTKAGSSTRAGAAAAAALRLVTARVGTKYATGTAAAPFTLAAAIGGVLHATPVAPTAVLLLAASIGGRFHTAAAAATAVLPLHAATVTSSVRATTPVGPAVIRLHAVEHTQRIVAGIVAVTARADTTVKYELVAVARVPQVAGPPMFLEVDPIDWTDLTWSESLKEPSTLSATVKIDTLAESILQRLRTPHIAPTELWLHRNGGRVFAGPLLGGRVSGESLSLEASGVLAYTRWMHVVADLAFTGIDQNVIVAALINQWQNQEYAHYGIDTTQVGVSGVLRTISYPYTELHKIADRITDLAEVADGFDLAIDPTSRQLELYHPIRGVDRSTGEDAIIFDLRNVTSSDITFSVGPADLASDGLGTATSTGSAAPLVATFANPELRAQFGRTGITGSFQVGDQGALDAAVQALVDARGQVLLIPGPNARVSLDADLSAYDVGDTIGYQAHARLTASGAWRIRKRTVRVSTTGTESVAVEFT